MTRICGILALIAGLTAEPGRSAIAGAVDRFETYYVAVHGNDDWSGRIAAPDAARQDGPFATLTRARDAVRSAIARKPLAPIRVLVRSGTYFLTEPLALDERDSGKASSPILWCAYPDERPVLSGGRPITGWKPHRGPIRVASLTELPQRGAAPHQLFHRGIRQVVARTPNFDRANPLYGGWAWMEAALGPGAFRYREGLLEHAPAKPGQAEVFQFVGPSGGWGSQFLAVTAIDPQRRVIHTRYDHGESTLLGFNSNCRFFLENSLESLDQPGEWCIDTEEKRIYFWPPDDGHQSGTDAVLAVLPSLLVILQAKWITISGFTFTETSSAGQAGVRCDGSEHIRIEKNRLVGLGSRGLEILGKERPCSHVTIQGNEVAQTGGSGIYIGGNASDCQVLDNEVHHCAVFDKYSAGIEFPFYGGTAADVGPRAYTDRVTIAHNHVHDVPRDGIQLGANPFGRNVVEFNRVERAASETIDAGAIRCHRVVSHLWGITPMPAMTGHVIRNNVVFETRGCGAQNGRIVTPQPWPTFGIYLDEGSSNCIVSGNVVGLSGTGVIINPGEANVIENNVFADNTVGIFYQAPAPFDGLSAPLGGNRFRHNIIETNAPDGASYTLSNWKPSTLVESDFNVFWSRSGPLRVQTRSSGENRATSHTFVDWQHAGYDKHSQLADPLFEKASASDYRLRPDSPALKLGFVPIDVSKAGIRPDWRIPR